MTDNQTDEAISVLVFAFYTGVFLWSIFRSKWPLLALNAVTAAVIVAYDVTPLRYVLEDWRLQFIVLFETAAIVAAVFAFRGNRTALWFSYIAGIEHIGTAGFIVWLAFFFRITRLF